MDNLDDSALTPGEEEYARQLFRGEIEGKLACVHCSGIHNAVAGRHPNLQPCPRVRAISWHTDGETITHVEYWADGEWPKTGIIFPDQVPVAPEDEEPDDS